MLDLDYLKYRVFYRLWHIWHCRLPGYKYFMKLVPTLGIYYDDDGHCQEDTFWERRHWITCCGDSRPWWHICCNGNAGGWRTAVCDYLEHKWRDTKHYNEG